MRNQLIAAAFIYFITIFTLLTAVYKFLDNMHMSELNFFVAGALVFLVAWGWGYVLKTLIFVPKENMEKTLTMLTDEIIHELNIPLSTIQANTMMLKKNTSDEKSLKRLQRIDDASHRLKKLYDELVYSIHKEMHMIEKERVELSSLLAERIAVFEDQQRNPFNVTIPSYEIYVDKIGFEQMFDNLISNAMKYSQKSAPISITLEDDTLKIKDRGIGMSSTELLRMHERYYQADSKKEGEGIGLFLVKSYCDNEEIDLTIQSEKGMGTTVFLNLSKVHVGFNT
jgi:two-component system OmpR family sensor kinase